MTSSQSDSIIFSITGGGSFAYKNCFAINGVIIVWSPSEPGFRIARIENNADYLAALRVLEKDEKVVFDLNGLRKLAVRHRWDNLGAMEIAIDDIENYFKVK